MVVNVPFPVAFQLPSVCCSLRLVFRPDRIIRRVALNDSILILSPGSAARCSAMDLAEAMSIVSPGSSALRGSGLSCSCGLVTGLMQESPIQKRLRTEA